MTPPPRAGPNPDGEARTSRLPSAAARHRNPPRSHRGELLTLLDFVRYAVSRFIEAKLVFAHGTTDPVAEAAFLVCETLHLHPDRFETFATARVTAAEAQKILDLIARRVTTRKPAAYLVNKIYMRGLPFYVDERMIVPRSFIGELLDSHFGGEGDEGGSLIDDPASRRKRARPLHRLGLPGRSWRAGIFHNAQIDAVDISKDALDVAARNVADYGLGDRVTLASGRPVQAARRQALRPDHFQSALCRRRRHGGAAARMPRRAETRLRRRRRRARHRPAHPGAGRARI